MINAILNLLTAGLTLWDDKEKHKYTDRLISLKEKYRAEMAKDDSHRSDANLDDIRFELLLLVTSFSASVNGQNSALKP